MIAWLRAHDPSFSALRRAARAAVIMPALFALGDKVIGNPALAMFAAFGSFAMLLMVDFAGPMRDRLVDQAALGVACAVLICLGTLASGTAWLAAVGMTAVAFVVLFGGVVSSVLAGATTALLLSFILPVSLPAGASSIPDRVAGWGLAAAASLLGISLLWPSPARNPLRAAAITACRALADRLRADVADVLGGAAVGSHGAAVARAEQAVGELERVFFATPSRPTGLSTDARAVVRLVDELRWLQLVVSRPEPGDEPDAHACAVKIAGADVLDRAAEALEHPDRPTEGLSEAVGVMRAVLGRLEVATMARAGAQASVSSLDPSFRAQELSFVIGQIATNTTFAAAAARRSWRDRLLGHQPEGLEGPLTAAQERAGSHLARDSLWLQNSLRGAVALGLAVLVAALSSVQHGFWVVFGTLAVLRSNALNTGQDVVRAVGGTAVGVVLGGSLVYLVGTNEGVLWALLPVAVLLAGLAPATISLAAGQVAFTLTLLILFNLIAPAGWSTGLLRVEDVALGCAVSLAVGALFWPAGAGKALGRALARAYADSARYLGGAVAYGADGRAAAPPPERQAVDAAAASRRLDEAFRIYLAERGAKPAPLGDIVALLTGVTGVRLAGDAVLELWNAPGARGGDHAGARRRLLGAAADITAWYERFALDLAARADVPDPPADDVVAEAVRGEKGVRLIWTADHLDAVRRLGETLVEPARRSAL